MSMQVVYFVSYEQLFAEWEERVLQVKSLEQANKFKERYNRRSDVRNIRIYTAKEVIE